MHGDTLKFLRAVFVTVLGILSIPQATPAQTLVRAALPEMQDLALMTGQGEGAGGTARWAPPPQPAAVELRRDHYVPL